MASKNKKSVLGQGILVGLSHLDKVKTPIRKAKITRRSSQENRLSISAQLSSKLVVNTEKKVAELGKPRNSKTCHNSNAE